MTRRELLMALPLAALCSVKLPAASPRLAVRGKAQYTCVAVTRTAMSKRGFAEALAMEMREARADLAAHASQTPESLGWMYDADGHLWVHRAEQDDYIAFLTTHGGASDRWARLDLNRVAENR